jgi:hypothetical protein
MPRQRIVLPKPEEIIRNNRSSDHIQKPRISAAQAAFDARYSMLDARI